MFNRNNYIGKRLVITTTTMKNSGVMVELRMCTCRGITEDGTSLAFHSQATGDYNLGACPTRTAAHVMLDSNTLKNFLTCEIKKYNASYHEMYAVVINDGFGYEILTAKEVKDIYTGEKGYKIGSYSKPFKRVSGIINTANVTYKIFANQDAVLKYMEKAMKPYFIKKGKEVKKELDISTYMTGIIQEITGKESITEEDAKIVMKNIRKEIKLHMAS